MNLGNILTSLYDEIESFFSRLVEFLLNGEFETRELARVRVPVVEDPRLILASSRRYPRRW